MTIHSVVIQKLLSTNAHLGRRVAAHHFKIYTYGTRNAMSIIDSDKTLICLRNACDFIGNLVRLNGRFLFVNTNPLVDEIIDQMIKKTGVRNDRSWRLSGFLTNSASPKKFRSRYKKLNLGSIYPPDCVVIMDTERKSSVILEADRLQIPIVGLVDSSMPWDTYKRITYPVPANDSVQFVYLFCNLITKTFLYEQKRLGTVIKEEEVFVPAQAIGEAATPIGKSKIDGADDELLVLPYESLLPASDDPLKTKELLDKLVVLKINRDLGTGVGFDGPKCAIEVCDGLTCLDLIANQIESLNSDYGCNIPLLLMNAVDTHDEISKVLEKRSSKSIHSLKPQPLKKRNTEDEAPCPSDDVEALVALKNSGKLDVLLSQGKEYILMLHSDNLADVVDPKILNHLVKNNIGYCMEVTQSALHPHKGKFQSEEKSELMRTTNLWLNIGAIETLESDTLKENHSISKFFDGAIGINVPQSRFLPLETTSDLLLFQSDLYTCSEGILTRNEARMNPIDPFIELGPEFEKIINFQSRFKSIPSIVDVDSLKVIGDVWFGTGVTLKGRVSIIARPNEKIIIPDGTVLENKIINSQQDIPEEDY